MSDVLVIRADATAATGAGHLMRCLNVAERWGEAGGGGVVVVGEVTLPFVRERLERPGITLSSPGADGGVDVPGAGVLLVDAYDPDIRRVGAGAEVAVRVLVDDLGEEVPAGYSMVWNPNAYGDGSLYREFGGPVLAGPESVPLRAGLPGWDGGGSGPGSLGAALGGGARSPILEDALARVAAAAPARRHLVIAGGGPDPWAGVDPSAPWDGLAGCDAVIVGAGTTLWEAAAVGVPCVAMQVADNQRPGARWAESRGVPVVDATASCSGATLAEELVTALSGARPLPEIHDGSRGVAKRLLAARDGAPGDHRESGGEPGLTEVRLRRARMADARTLWFWADDPDTRAASFDRSSVEWPDHVAWLRDRLGRDDHVLLLAESSRGRPLASVRFDSDDGWRRARLSVVVAPEARGRGVGSAALRAGLERLRSLHPGTTVHADVRADNEASLRLFRCLGWRAADGGFDRVRFQAPRPAPAGSA